MNKLTLVTVAHLVLGTSIALADSKSDAQAKVDAAKTATCEKAKKFLTGQAAKGRCKPELEEANKLTCSAATFKPMNDLLVKCTSAKPADSKGDKAAPATTAPACRALGVDDKALIVQAEDKLFTKCTRLLVEKLEAKWCTADAKGKKLNYVIEFDHTMGSGKYAKPVKGGKRSLTCRRVAK